MNTATFIQLDQKIRTKFIEAWFESKLLDQMVVNEHIGNEEALDSMNYALYQLGFSPVTIRLPDGSGSRSKFNIQIVVMNELLFEGLSPSYDGTSLDDLANWLEGFIDMEDDMEEDYES